MMQKYANRCTSKNERFMKTRIFLLAVAAALWTTAVGQTKTIIEQQCWLDGNLSAVQPAGTSVDISALAPGVHTYSIRVKDSEGMWSPVVTKYFIIPRAIEPATNIAACEYWLDGNVALRASIDASPAQISLTDLGEGLHSFTMRVQDNNGAWSSPVTKYFLVPAQERTIARYLYWFDNDEANSVTGELSSASGVLPVNIAHLSEGEHTLSWRVADSKGVWSDTIVESFTFTHIQLTDDMVSLAEDYFVYTGVEITPAVTVIDGETVLQEDVDYTVSYAENIYPGTASVTVTAKENSLYKGQVTKTYLIDKATPQISAPTAIEGLVYSGEPQVLAEAGTTTGGEMQYSLDADTWSTEIPTATNAGEYQVYYQVIGDDYYYGIVINWIYATIAKAASVITTAPVALEGLQTKGEPVVLITAGAAIGGEMQYSLDGEDYSAELPTVNAAGTYTVSYMVVGDENHTDIEAQTLEVVVEVDHTDIDQVQGDKVQSTKVLRNGMLFIERNGKTYSIVGTEITAGQE